MRIKTEVEGVLRDVNNGALLNSDNQSLIAYKKMKKRNMEIDEMKNDIDGLKNDISDIKGLLNKIAEKL